MTVTALAAMAVQEARGQTNNPPAAPASATNTVGATNAPGGTNAVAGTNVTSLGDTTVVGNLNQAITQILPSVGATKSVKDEAQILTMPSGNNAPINQIITHFPGVAEDSAENGDLHVRGEHANLQYRIDGVLLPEGIAGFGLELDPRFIQSMR